MQDQDVSTPIAEPSNSDPAYVPEESTIDTGSDDSEKSITLVSEPAEVDPALANSVLAQSRRVKTCQMSMGDLPQGDSGTDLSDVCVTPRSDSLPSERTPEVSDIELDDPEESCADHVSAYSTIELTARQTARFRKMLRQPVSYCQPAGRTTTLKKLLNFKILGEDGLVKCAPALHLFDLVFM